MNTIPELFALATQHHRAGRLANADLIYRQILSIDPNNADAHHLSGLIAFQTGKSQFAVENIRRAIELNGKAAAFHLNLGIVLASLGNLDEAGVCFCRALELNSNFAKAHEQLGNTLKLQGKLEEAAGSYRRAMEIVPDNADLPNNLGIVLQEQGKYQEAVIEYHRALKLNPGYAVAHNNLGTVLQHLGKFDEAVECFVQTLKLDSAYAEAYSNLGNTLKQQGKLDEAVASHQRAVELKPDSAEAHINLGSALQDQGNLDAAISSYRRALELKPDLAETHYNLGIVLQKQAKYTEAIAAYRNSLELNPEYAQAHNSLGAAFLCLGKVGEATTCFRHALSLTPDDHKTHCNLGNALENEGKLDEAVACYRSALKLTPDSLLTLSSLVHQMQHMCLWEGLDELSKSIIKRIDEDSQHGEAPVPPFSFLSLPTQTTNEQQLRSATARANVHGTIGSDSRPRTTFDSVSHAKSKITIGYLSADFHSHATAWLIAELLEKHNRNRFNIHAYSFGPDDGSPTRRRIVSAFDRFVDLRTDSLAAAAQKIAADDVDILVDLKGYTQNARTQILAHRPAPIQVNYLGYPGTMGASFMDYILVDDYIVPADQQPFYSEKLVHLPGCYQVNDSQREISSRTPTRAECNLPEDGFVFCCFNNSFKITSEMFGAWMELLKAVPGSVLWLLEGNRFAASNLRREAQVRDVSPERLVFAPRHALPEHLARHRMADLFLDTLPYNAHTTASDALWAGCPLLTLSGSTFASRVAGSLLTALDLPELITTSLDQYKAMALKLARDNAFLAGIRCRLLANRQSSSLFDGGQFARNLESAYQTMWDIHSSGEKPRAFEVTHDALAYAD